ncbi:hypothetical protein H4I96_06548 [Botrytis cinerea]
MFANDFKASDPSKILAVRDQKQEEEYLSDSDEMVNLRELVEIHQQHYVGMNRFHEERRLENNDLHHQHYLEIAELYNFAIILAVVLLGISIYIESSSCLYISQENNSSRRELVCKRELHRDTKNGL